ncbi:DUF1840 domain-containing protein [Shewanella psychrotolerans]|uniref:DUF1840 domain-containing protein n=1 Tax=Shewanella psychrotolerans TaxID=2864206 RepID=UPI001C656487|nr:DUF1840 domain-containing protein [Shewanella psychrotolerans]QYK02227.1 DUF1840 domain-containing protein [Shewanella psychrotolerans]
MLVTFKSDNYANITLFGDVAKSLLKIMGHSGSVPGAFRTEDVPAALEKLSHAVAIESPPPTQASSDDDEESEQYISLRHRALPLIELLESAKNSQSNVMWE